MQLSHHSASQCAVGLHKPNGSSIYCDCQHTTLTP